MCVVAGVLLSLGTIAIDRALDYDVVPRWMTGGPDSALAILETIATSMLSLATLVLTITMVVVQLAMGQFSPRIVQNFLRDKPSQIAIGLFVATFAHAMLSMREVQFDGEGQVPGIAIAVGYALVIVSIAMLVIYVEHIGRSLRVSALIELVGTDTRRLLDRQYPEQLPAPPPDPHVVPASRSGVVTAIDREHLVRVASEADCVLHVVPSLGTFVPAGSPLVTIEGDPARVDHRAVERGFTWALERNLDEDIAYGFRMLVDVGEKALADSPFLDPTTAVQALDRLHDGLRQLATRAFPDGRCLDDAGRVRVTVPVMTWEAYVHLAFDEIRLAGVESPQVSRRLVAALTDLLDVAPPERRDVLVEQLELVRGAVRDAPRDVRDQRVAVAPDMQGIGVRAGEDGQRD